MRNVMHWRSYDSQRAALMRRHAIAFLSGFICMLALVLVGITAAAAQQIPAEANRYKLTLKREAQRVWGLNAPIASFAAQIHQESGWNPNARSVVGAQGLSQFMPTTATWISGLYPSLADRTPMNPTWAIRALVTYDAKLFSQVRRSNNDCQRFAFALSAYNGGMGWVNKRQAISNQPGLCFDSTCSINPGISAAAQRENQAYPLAILLRHQKTYANWGQGICP